MLECQSRLDEAGQTGSLLRVTDVRLDRPDRTKSLAACMEPKGPRKGLNLDRISCGSSGGVAFDVADGICPDLRCFQCFHHRASLTGGAGCRVTDFTGPIVVHRAALDDRVNVIAMFESGRDRFEQDCRHTAAENRADAGGVERSAMPVGRMNATSLRQIPTNLRDANRRRSGHRHIALTAQ